jgi:hypothetical protein
MQSIAGQVSAFLHDSRRRLFCRACLSKVVHRSIRTAAPGFRAVTPVSTLIHLPTPSASDSCTLAPDGEKGWFLAFPSPALTLELQLADHSSWHAGRHPLPGRPLCHSRHASLHQICGSQGGKGRSHSGRPHSRPGIRRPRRARPHKPSAAPVGLFRFACLARRSCSSQSRRSPE